GADMAGMPLLAAMMSPTGACSERGSGAGGGAGDAIIAGTSKPAGRMAPAGRKLGLPLAWGGGGNTSGRPSSASGTGSRGTSETGTGPDPGAAQEPSWPAAVETQAPRPKTRLPAHTPLFMAASPAAGRSDLRRPHAAAGAARDASAARPFP